MQFEWAIAGPLHPVAEITFLALREWRIDPCRIFAAASRFVDSDDGRAGVSP
jgi:hypothetical protein